MFNEEDIVIKDTSFDNVIKVFEKNIQDNYNNYKNCSDVAESKLYLNAIEDTLNKISQHCTKILNELETSGLKSSDGYNLYSKRYNDTLKRIDIIAHDNSKVTAPASNEMINEDGDNVKIESDVLPIRKTKKKRPVVEVESVIEFNDDINEPKEPESKSEQPREVQSVSSAGEFTYDEVRNETNSNEIYKSDKPEMKEAVRTDDLIKPAHITSIPKAQLETPKEDVKSVKVEVALTQSKEEASADKKDDVVENDAIEIESEDTAKIIIAEDKPSEKEDEIDEDDYLSDGPIVNDDVDMELSKEELDNVEIFDKESEEKTDDNVDDGSNAIDADKTYYETSKVISRKRENPMFKTLAKLDNTKYDLAKVSVFDYDGSDEQFRKEYILSRNNMMAAPRVSRVALLMSGHYEEISAYGSFDFGTISRRLTDDSLDFVDREVFLYNSIYSHIMYCSYAKSVPDFDTWCKNIYYPDANSLFFGVYDANSVGVNNYLAECPMCGKQMIIPRENKDLAVAVSNVFKKDDLATFITYKDIMKRDNSPMYKWARDTTIRKQLRNTKYIIDYGVPTLYDYLTTIATMRRIAANKEIDIDLSSVESFSDPETALRIYHYMYIKRIGVPSIVQGTNKIKFIGLTSKADIIEFLNNLDINDWSQLINDNEISEFITKSACDYYIADAKCNDEKCGHVIKHLLFNPKKAVFFKIGEVRANLS